MIKNIKKQNLRLEAIDLARYFALIGMIFINFKLAIQPIEEGYHWISIFFNFIQGKASATFLVLAGIGFTLGTKKLNTQEIHKQTYKRAIFLFIIGMINLIIFPADIIHYYAVYFIIGMYLLKKTSKTLILFIILTIFLSFYWILNYNYSKGWNWSTLEYIDLWTINVFFRHLLFNGFHPVFPWVTFLIYGIFIGRLNLNDTKIQIKLFIASLIAMITSYIIATLMSNHDYILYFQTSSMPATPVYILTGMGSSGLIIVICTYLVKLCKKNSWSIFIPAGRMTLTLYIAHIVIGMGILEKYNWLNNEKNLNDVLISSIICILAVTLFAKIWSMFFSRGPLEILMQKVINIKIKK